MNDSLPELIRIGEFSRMTRISIRMLRHYQQRGLLLPAWTEPFSGYRFYHVDQLSKAVRIRQYRDVGLRIDQIAQALAANPEDLRSMLQYHGDQLRQEISKTESQLSLLEYLISESREEAMTVVRKTVPAHTRAALRSIIADYGAEGELWGQIMPLIHRAGLPLDSSTQCGATFYDSDYKETDTDVEVWVTVKEPFSTEGPLACQEIPSFEAISTTVTGSYDKVMYGASDALATYAAENSLKVGLMYNVYLVGPGASSNPEEYVTEVCAQILG